MAYKSCAGFGRGGTKQPTRAPGSPKATLPARLMMLLLVQYTAYGHYSKG